MRLLEDPRHGNTSDDESVRVYEGMVRFQSDPVFQMFPCLQPEARFKDIALPRENNHRRFSSDDNRGDRDNGRSNDPPRQRERERDRDRERSRRSPEPPTLGKRSREEDRRGDSNLRRFSDDDDHRTKRPNVGSRSSHHESQFSAHDYLHTSLAEIDSLVQSRSTLASQEPVKPRGPFSKSSAAPPVPGRRVVSIPTPPPSRLFNYSRSR